MFNNLTYLQRNNKLFVSNLAQQDSDEYIISAYTVDLDPKLYNGKEDEWVRIIRNCDEWEELIPGEEKTFTSYKAAMDYLESQTPFCQVKDGGDYCEVLYYECTDKDGYFCDAVYPVANFHYRVKHHTLFQYRLSDEKTAFSDEDSIYRMIKECACLTGQETEYSSAIYNSYEIAHDEFCNGPISSSYRPTRCGYMWHIEWTEMSMYENNGLVWTDNKLPEFEKDENGFLLV